MEKIITNKKNLSNLTGKKFITFTESGDHAIMEVLKNLFLKGYKKILIQDQGGWFSYLKYPKKIGFETIKLKTDYGLIDMDDLEQKADSKSILLVNSLTGYFAEQEMKKIYEICKAKKCFLINDVSGSIGREIARFGDLALGSFGEHKPIEIGKGGFIASNFEFGEDFDIDHDKLERQIKELGNKILYFDSVRKKVINDLKDFKIIHKEKKGINVVVKYHNEREKERVIDYCKSKNLEYVLCPNYIKVNERAVSIEIKRLK